MICTLMLLVVVQLAEPAAYGQAAFDQPGAAAEIVSRQGLRAVDPPTPSKEFRLPDLAGGERALSDFSGKWVVLTFWATWCGPCRAEMPSLERLHLSRQSEGLAVLGVSIDRMARSAEGFVADYGLTFPNLWDGRGQAAAEYRAASIPVSYLIDPSGLVVGQAVGARDWMALQPMIDELLELDWSGEPAAGAYETTTEPIELPRTFQPPTAEVASLEDAPEAGKPFSLEVRVRWAGNFEDYLLHPPRVHLPENVVQEGQRASTSSADGRNIVSYRIDLLASEPGSYSLNPIELVYTPRDEAEPISSRVVGPTVEVAPATILGLEPGALAAGGAGLVAALIGVGATAYWLRGRERARPLVEDSGSERLKRRVDAARALRMEGDLSGAVLALSEIERELGVDGEKEAAALERRLEGARYGGYAPTPEELDGIERRVARRVREMVADPLEAEREALQLRNQES